MTPPLDPSPDEAHALLRGELAHPEYHQRDVLQQLYDALVRLVNGAIHGASQSPPVSAFAAMVAFLALGLALAWLLGRARRTARAAGRPGAVVEDRTVGAEELRRRAERALAEGRAGDAVVDGFRALAVRQAEQGYVDDLPGATAHEVAVAVGAAHPEARGRVAGTAALFDQVLYGDRPATPAQASDVLELDDVLRGWS
ncbi:DUF4129 domain-containing protein [Nocardioides mangrovi]|uniref:DUF4129 domain-containing protein n=1 Tax=Nocardioides mangrovi TaxID=2874580 RepID=A0ABS7UFJ1_9ACTN|nr:DUF4129 domain-containing protein [Nocardioides mangrovi]MBZ5739619.1 DUF4129 domain-containing protein [Nocardioides mangrovi]